MCSVLMQSGRDSRTPRERGLTMDRSRINSIPNSPTPSEKRPLKNQGEIQIIHSTKDNKQLLTIKANRFTFRYHAHGEIVKADRDGGKQSSD